MRILSFIFALLVSSNVLAAGGSTEETVAGLQRVYQGASTWQADFSQATFVGLIGREISKNGNIRVKKPGKLRLEYTGRNKKLYVSNGKKLWVYSEEDSQVESFSKVSQMVANEALIFLQGFGDVKREFKVGEAAKSAVGIKTKGLKVLALTPIREDSSVEKMILGVDPKDHLVKELLLINSSGNTTRYLFKNIRLNSPFDDSVFEYKKPAGVREIKG